jgi:SAM-dependent methyltransferase
MSGAAGLRFELIDPREQLASPLLPRVEAFLRAAHRTALGWHYLTDIVWIARQVSTWPQGIHLLDAGGGTGALQLLLAEMGFDITNVDLNAGQPSRFLRGRYGVELERLPSHTETSYNRSLLLRRRSLASIAGRNQLLVAFVNWQIDRWRRRYGMGPGPGRIRWVQGNLAAMPEIADGRFDGIVSLSAVEHIPVADLPRAIAEMRRVVRPGNLWAVTTSATDRAETWFHEPSQGLCFALEDLVARFGAENVSRLDPADALAAYRDCRYLEQRLAPFYRASGENGMPWGIWDPTYIPVGIFGPTTLRD